MNRTTLSIIFLLVSSTASAEQLYRWIEPDGSITFSPSPPTTGVDYKTIDSSAGAISGENADAALEAISAARESEPPLATAQIDQQTQSQLVSGSATGSLATASEGSTPTLRYAPETGLNRSQPIAQITRSAEIRELASQQQNNSTATLAAQTKRQHCVDLGKRVVSLERRLSAGLSADDMDNTVIAMARYQRSYDQYCIE